MEPMMEKRGEPKQTETDRMIGELLIYGLIGIIGILFFLPVMLGMLIFAIINLFQRDWISYVGLATGAIILFWQFQTGRILSYFGLISELNIPYMSASVERFLNQGNAIAATSTS